ncbi:MAG: NAD-dependent epimerase/dehydratase family protein [Methylococcales bacterium]|nr:NAD-dependent epimerase/dehydratase family protein [Methylococcales bacterium]
MTSKKVLVCGAGGFIGHHLVNRYKQEGFWVRGVDIKYPEFEATQADEFLIADLRYPEQAQKALDLQGESFDEVCQLAANMGGMGFIATHHSEIMHDSSLINLSVLEECRKTKAKKLLYTSSACMYPEYNQLEPTNPKCSEDSAYPAFPDTEYGWEKLYSERLYKAYEKDYGMDNRVVRLHNVFGPEGTWRGGREKAPAAICRKIAEATDGATIEIWGKGDQTRSFLYIDECIEGLRRVMQAPKGIPILNIGSEESISINNLAQLVARIANKKISIVNGSGYEGVRGRNSDNTLIQKTLGWAPSKPLEEGLKKTYPWIVERVTSTQ